MLTGCGRDPVPVIACNPERGTSVPEVQRWRGL